jgi:hypothetical protein
MKFEDKNILDLQPGDIVHSHGARFEVASIKVYGPSTQGYSGCYDENVMSADAKWIDGDIIRGYFGPFQNWNFQGNKNVTVRVES